MDSTRTTESSQQVYFYEGVIPKSGKQVFEFGGRKFCHRSIVKDKSDLLVDVETRVVLMSYPLKSERSLIVNNLADNIKKLEHFIHHPESFEVIQQGDLSHNQSKEAESVLKVYSMPREPSYSRSGNYAHLNKDADVKIVKKKIDVRNQKW